MAKTKISEFSSTPGNNTDIDGINIAEGCAPSGINDAIRELMSQLKDFQTGSAGDSFNGPVGTTTAAAGAFTTLSASSTVSGTGFSTYLASPPAIGGTAAAAGSFTTLSASSTVTLSGGTANGVLYLNGSKVATSGSALTFDGTVLTNTGRVKVGGAGNNAQLEVAASSGEVFRADASGGAFRIVANQTDTLLQGSSSIQSWINGSEQMRLDSTGLGIGTTPSYKLVSGVARGSVGWALYNTNAGTYDGWISSTSDNGLAINARGQTAGNGTGNTLYLQTGDTTRATLDASGNLGLGVTPSAWRSGARALQLGQTGYASLNEQANGSTSLNFNCYESAANTWTYYVTGVAPTRYTQQVGVHSWFTAASGTAGNAISFTQAMTLDASGNLGIGETSPSTYGRFIVRGTGFVASAIAGDSTSETQLRFLTNTGARISQQANQPLIFDTNATERARIDTTGNFSLATNGTSFQWTNSGNNVAINGASGVLSFYTGTSAYNERARITSGGDFLVGNTAGGSGSLGRITTRSDGGTPLAVSNENASGTLVAFMGNGSGNIGSITHNGASVSYNTTSDYRLKNNPQPLTGSGAFIDALKPKTWAWKADGSKGVGFIAHEVQEVSPGSVVGEKDGEQMQAMEYGSAEFIANIIAELQSLRARVAQLEKGN